MGGNPWQPHRKAKSPGYITGFAYPDAPRQPFHVIIPEWIGCS
ncbi:Hypothetical protein GbCGDNIH2_8125 [Granulibacter bethesdensis]|nr:Hypothetical protein GbCGDNIH2_8125 [Granulibacter bethesdensis]APH52704.1 Hypothetical protein GbCGDNIH5_8125 [Granulibacter bethesdensis]